MILIQSRCNETTDRAKTGSNAHYLLIRHLAQILAKTDINVASAHAFFTARIILTILDLLGHTF